MTLATSSALSWEDLSADSEETIDVVDELDAPESGVQPVAHAVRKDEHLFGALLRTCVLILDSDTIADRIRTELVSALRTQTGETWVRATRGESVDLAPCGSLTLDEWAARLVARVLDRSAGDSTIRRAVRDAGICAFGLSY